MTDDRPEPRYGQYAPGPPPEPSPPPAEPNAPVPQLEPRRRTWDVAITTALLLIGVVDVVSTYGQFLSLADGLKATYASQGYGTFTSVALANSMGLALNISRIVILVVTIILSLWRIRLGKRSFWVPLAGGALAAAVVSVGIVVVILQDPALLAQFQSVPKP